MTREEKEALKMLDRGHRMEVLANTIDNYVAAGDQLPPHTLEVMANLILNEELSDTSSNKATLQEYPVYSQSQISRQDEKISWGSDKALEALASNGSFYFDKKAQRRVRLQNEAFTVDEAVQRRIKNKARKRQYNEFTRPGPVHIYYI
jgi:hypothetical protein